MTTFSKEPDFELAVIRELSQRGWEKAVIKNPTEADLLNNWATILFENNKGIDRLNDVPLTKGEMDQIMEQITKLRTPLKLNGFINGKTVTIKRDNPEDKDHYGKEISLKIYDRHEIAAGQSRYQIVQQPRFKRGSKLLNDRRGDMMLLINGMPVIHIELKRSGVPVSQAYNQIQKYSNEGIFSSLFSLVQLFVAMEPAEALYFANPGPDGTFNKDYAFHWADFNNEPINNWQAFTSGLLSIPMAHQLIGFYTVADESDGVLKVMRSYQYYAAHAISDKVAKTDWKNPNRLGGYIWHTTGSGKTMTSFKSAQLIANSKDADKVVFLLDRIELGTQTLEAYRHFAGDSNDVQATEDASVLASKLKSSNPADTLIVTSIQKMSRIKDEEGGLKAADLEKMRSKRIVFIVDECHRSTFGGKGDDDGMLLTIKKSFRGAVFFGFTGTPIQTENIKKENTTTDVFGNELHRYSIADGIRDKNVLGFDPYKVMTYRDRDLRQAIALEKSRASTPQEALSDPNKARVFNRYMNDVTMAGCRDNSGQYVKGIEDHLPNAQYQRDEHRNAVVADIADNWVTLSQNSKFHAIFATSSIEEAIIYYRLMKSHCPQLKTTALFDPNEDNENPSAFKSDGLVELLEDYNARYGQSFDVGGHARFKKDVAARLAHKKPYTRIGTEPNKQIDLLIVVNQMLTGFDSKWINTLYLDKRLEYENIIQAFSRTNRLFGPDKPFGTIRYYRRPHTVERNIAAAVRLYSGNRPIGLFVDRLPSNIQRLNATFAAICAIFDAASIINFRRLPDNLAARAAFAREFNELSNILEAAKIQGFTWEQTEYKDEDGTTVVLAISEAQYLTLLQRYRELGTSASGGGGALPFDIDSHITEIDTGKIDADYMNSRFEKYIKVLDSEDEQAKEKTLAELHRSFASLSQEEQKYAEIFLRDIHRGDVQIDATCTFRDYINDYQAKARNEEVDGIVKALGIDPEKLHALMNANTTEANLNEYGRFDELKKTIDKQKARLYFEEQTGESLSLAKVNIKAATLLRTFILVGMPR
ncbi:type I restriction endonuclease subunit R [Acaryochloris marina NIES-2412]|uniref:type I restriction endonuclease subunit R n=1 Tax=Acaryochloris marina TaxID=155978 RepID=UPI004058A228